MVKTFFMRLLQILAVIGLLGLSSCVEDVKDCPEIFIDNSKLNTSVDISLLVDTISIIELNEPADNLMGDIIKAEAGIDRYFFYDLHTNKINAFFKDGRFDRTVSKAGERSEDPLNITNFWVRDGNQIQVYDFAQMKIFDYDSQLRFKRSIRSTQFNHFNSIKPIPNSKGYVGYASYNMFNDPYNGKFFQLAFLDSNLKIYKSELHYPEKYEGILLLTYPEHFYKFRDTLRFFKAYDNTIYSITKTGTTPAYRIFYKKNGLPDNIFSIIDTHLTEFKDQRSKKINTLNNYFADYVRFSGGWIETKKYILITSFQKDPRYNNRFYSIVSRPDNKVVFSARTLYVANAYKMKLPPFTCMDSYTNEIISVIDGSALFKLLSNESKFVHHIDNTPQKIYLVKVKLK